MVLIYSNKVLFGGLAMDPKYEYGGTLGFLEISLTRLLPDRGYVG
jgi:hypothetical protein